MPCLIETFFSGHLLGQEKRSEGEEANHFVMHF
jgi:hypothetical protein